MTHDFSMLSWLTCVQLDWKNETEFERLLLSEFVNFYVFMRNKKRIIWQKGVFCRNKNGQNKFSFTFL